MYSGKTTFSERATNLLRRILSCCDKEDEEEAKPALQISGPTNFRREDITIPGLDPAQQHYIRTKAITDAQKLYAHLQPLRSSPSGHFASPTSPKMHTYEEFTTPRPHASPVTSTPGSRVSALEKVRRHSRKISNSLTPKGGHFGGGGYLPVGTSGGLGGDESKYEMRSLIEPGEMVVVPLGKQSGESLSVGGSELEDRDSGKVMKL